MINLRKLPNQQRDEQTVLFLRRHWIELLTIGFYAIALSAVPVLILVAFNFAGGDPFMHPFWGIVTQVLLGVYGLMVMVITITQFTDYYLDTWIVTNERIINIEQQGLFSRVTSELHLNEVQDVTSETHGFLETFLTYGDVYIQTAATRERFNFRNVDNPTKVKAEIIRLVQEDKVRHGDASQTGVAAPARPERE
jgi:membrane protein YdbS with pleckstrin-like domain